MPRVLIDSHRTRVLIDSHHTMRMPMCDKIHHLWITYNDHFTKQIHLFLNQKLFGCYTSMIIYIYINHVSFAGSEFSVSHRRLRMPSNTFTGFHRWRSFLTTTNGSFTQGGVYPCLLLPDTYFILAFHITVRPY